MSWPFVDKAPIPQGEGPRIRQGDRYERGAICAPGPGVEHVFAKPDGVGEVARNGLVVGAVSREQPAAVDEERCRHAGVVGLGQLGDHATVVGHGAEEVTSGLEVRSDRDPVCHRHALARRQSRGPLLPGANEPVPGVHHRG
jgi:hypothetical protein